MARTSNSRTPKLAVVSGETTQVAYGVAGGSGTSTTVTIPQARGILAAVVTGHASPTQVMYIDTDSSNTFTVTHDNAAYFDWIAVVIAKM